MTVWVVGRLSDKIKEQDRPPKRSGPWAHNDAMWPEVFFNRDDAVDYLLARARREVEQAATELAKAQKRLKAAQKKVQRLAADYATPRTATESGLTDRTGEE